MDFICIDDSTRTHSKLDVVRLLIKTKHSKVLMEDVEVMINDSSFNIKLVKDS